MICSQCCASAALQQFLVALQLADALSADRNLAPYKGFCHIISDHLVCQTICNVNVVFGLLICDIEVLDVQMTRVLASTLASIGLKQHGTSVVLIEDILLNWISLCLKK